MKPTDKSKEELLAQIEQLELENKKLRAGDEAGTDKASIHSAETCLKVLNQLPDLILQTDLTGKIVYVNDSPLGSPVFPEKEHILGASIFDFFVNDELDRARENVRKMLDKPLGNIEYRLRVGDEREITVEVNGKVLLDTDEQAEGMIFVIREVSERKMIEKALQDSETRFRMILENMPILLNAFDEHGQIVVWNKACEKCTGYKAKEIINNPRAMELLYPDPAYRQMVFEKSDNNNLNENTFDLLSKTGEKRTVTWFDTYHKVKIPGWTSWGLGLDITESKRAAEKLIMAKERAEESDRLKDAFINNISHEIRTPLNSILGFAQFLIEPNVSAKERADNYALLKKSSTRLVQTVTDIMDVSLISAGSITPNQQSFQVGELMKELLEKTKHKCSEKNIVVSLEVPSGFEKMVFISDKELITKILDQLLNNAEKFTRQGRIVFGFSAGESSLEFFVKDTGKGIAPDKQDIIFEAFAQEDISSTRGYEGSGLGLTIAKGLVNLLGGEIRLESGLQKGTDVYVSIPGRIEITEDTGAAYDKHEEPETGDGSLVLIAEDDVANHLYLETVLRLSGMDSLHAENGKEAVRMCQDYPEIAIVLMDIKMPVMNGLEATRLIKTIRPDLPVIAVTAHAQTGDEKRMLDAGCDAYIAKPASKPKLLQLINAYTNLNKKGNTQKQS